MVHMAMEEIPNTADYADAMPDITLQNHGLKLLHHDFFYNKYRETYHNYFLGSQKYEKFSVRIDLQGYLTKRKLSKFPPFSPFLLFGGRLLSHKMWRNVKNVPIVQGI